MFLHRKKKRFSKLFNKYYKKLYNYAFKVTKEKIISEEVVQDSFIKLWENFEKIKEVDRSIEAYLMITLKNKIIDYYRKSQTQIKHINLYTDNKETELNIDAQWELTDKIDLIYSKLPEKTVEIFKLSRDKGLTYQEISVHKNISIKTVELHISKALTTFRKDLKEYF